MKAFSELIPEVLQGLYSEGVDESSFNKNRAEYSIRRAYREFIRQTRMVRRTWVFDTQANVSEYPLYTYDGEIATKIYSVTVNGCCYVPGKICGCGCCPGTYYYDGHTLHLCPPPECDGEDIEVCVSVIPESSVCEMDDRIYEMYGEAIVSGAIHYLLSKKVSAPYQVQFDAGVARGARDAARQWSTGRNTGQRKRWVRR